MNPIMANSAVLNRDNQRSYVSIYSGKDCGNGTNMQLIHHTAHNALATLVLRKNSTACDFIENDQKVMTRRSDDALSNLTENNASSFSLSTKYVYSPRWRLGVIFILCYLLL